MQGYIDLLKSVLEEGKHRADRTQVGTLSCFGKFLDLKLDWDSFPLLTTKKVYFKSIAYELLWFLKGDTDIKFLKDNGVSIWDEWADESGQLGPIYGKQWRNFGGVDQIKKITDQIKSDPYSRRIMVSAWNVSELQYMNLQPCHVLFQFYVDESTLSCQVYQRSADIFLGVPFNIASYALLVYMLCKTLDLEPGRLIFSFGDIHIYKNHIAQVKEQIARLPRKLPRLTIVSKRSQLEDYVYSDFLIDRYDPHPTIKAPIAV